MKLSVRNLNKPRPKWAKKLSKAVRGLGLLAVSLSWKFGSIDGAMISAMSGFIADTILDFTGEDEQPPKEVDPTEEQAIIN